MRSTEKFTNETEKESQAETFYRERCIRLQKENEELKRMLDKIQKMVFAYSNG